MSKKGSKTFAKPKAKPQRANKLGTRPGKEGASPEHPEAAVVAGKVVDETRLCVKGLPAELTEAKLRELFAPHGEVTDAKIMRTQDGRSRKFAFVGFSTAEAAKAALKHTNKSFLGTCRLQVEFALPPGDAKLPRAWSKYTDGTSAHESATKGPETAAKTPAISFSAGKRDPKRMLMQKYALIGLNEEQSQKLADDPQFKDFLAIMMPRRSRKAKFWDNDEGLTQASRETYEALQEQERKAKGKGDDEDGAGSDDEYDANPILERDGVGQEEEEATEPAAAGAGADVGEETAKSALAHDSGISDMDYFRSKQAEWSDQDEEGDGQEGKGEVQPMDESQEEEAEEKTKRIRKKAKGGEDEDEESEEDGSEVVAGASVGGSGPGRPASAGVDRKEEKEEKETREEDGGAAAEDEEVEEGRLFVRNLPYSVTDEDVEKLFKQFGAVTEVHIPLDANKRCKGYAYVTFMFPEHAARAYASLHDTTFQGRLLSIHPARAKPKSKAEEALEAAAAGKDGFKAHKMAKLKAEALRSDNWNSIFIRADTVAAAMADRLGVNKGEIREAVKEAIAETQLIKETKEFLKENGVHIPSFDEAKSKTARSKTVILVKNIPYETKVEELKRLFGKYGSLGRAVLPPTRTLALVEFHEPSDAKTAFKALAYRQFKGAPLYLEWAPQAIFTSPPPAKGGAVTAAAAQGKAEPEAQVEAEAEMKEEDIESGVLYVKNLNFDTTEEQLRKVFEEVGELRSVTVAKKRNAKKKAPSDRDWLSMGFGFVEYRRKSDALKALKTLQRVQVDGHELDLKLSHKAAGNAAEDAKITGKRKERQAQSGEAPSTKIIVKNVPFEAPINELKEVFGAFGQIKRTRMPKKFDGGHRGFAFIDFVTKQEAKNAFEALFNTHFYGRRLVLEWAKEDEDLEGLREKTLQQFEKGHRGRGSRAIDAAPDLDGSSRPKKKRKIEVGQGDDSIL